MANNAKMPRVSIRPKIYPEYEISLGQQWDFPNCWPPLQHMVVEGLEKSGHPEAQRLALRLAALLLLLC